MKVYLHLLWEEPPKYIKNIYKVLKSGNGHEKFRIVVGFVVLIGDLQENCIFEHISTLICVVWVNS